MSKDSYGVPGYGPIIRRTGFQGIIWARLPRPTPGTGNLAGMGSIAWECPHVHRTEKGARRCAEKERG